MGFFNQPVTLIPTSKRKIGDVTLNVVISENTSDNLTITKQPVQQGAAITDHAYKEPTSLTMSIYFSANLGESLREIYQDLLDLQTAREPVTVTTPKRTYYSMLVSAIGLTTDQRTENTLAVTVSFQEIILVPVSTVIVPRTKQTKGGATQATQKSGQKDSILLQGGQAVNPGLPGVTLN